MYRQFEIHLVFVMKLLNANCLIKQLLSLKTIPVIVNV